MFYVRFAFAALLFYLAAFFHAANADTISILDWQSSISPFARSQSLNNLAITSSADISHVSRVNMTWSCTKSSGTALAVGITNGDLDYSPVTNKLPVQLKVDTGGVTAFPVVPDSMRRFVIAEHLDPRAMFANDVGNIYKTYYLYVGFPVNGEDVVLRIAFQESGVRQFMKACLAALQDNHAEKKQIQSEAVKPAPAEVKHVQAEVQPTPVMAAMAAPATPAPVPPPVAQAPVQTAQAAQNPIDIKPPTSISASVSGAVEIETKPLPPAASAQPEPPVDTPRKALRWKELGKYNLDGGEVIALRSEYSAGSAKIHIGPLYKDIPHGETQKVALKTGEVTLGGEDVAGRNTALSVVDVHTDRDGLDDWYLVQVMCTGCPSDAMMPTGWVAAGDVVSWRDDPLCVLGTKECN